MRHWILFTALCLGTLFSSAMAQQATPTPDGSLATPTEKTARYRIGYQDLLEITVYNHKELLQKVSVSPNGTINLFRLDQPVVAVCKTEDELARAIEAAYKVDYLRDPRVNVLVSEQHSQAVAVIGAVEKPGSFYINRKYHLLEMLALAGGPSREAGTRVLVARTGASSNCRTGEDPDSDQIMVSDFKIRDVQEGKVNFWMEPGDVVSVLDADVVYVYGSVNKQGAIRVREPLTLTQAIVSAEGLTGTAKKSGIRVLRQKPGSVEREELTFDLGQIDKGKVKDPYLESGDIVAVSGDTVRKILQAIGNGIKTSVPSAVYRIP